jgi:glycosyltransferase domain-containing protein
MDIFEQQELTIILQIRDRHRYTIRWLNYALKKNCRFKIYIADGSSNNEIKKYLNRNKSLQKLDIKYVKTDYDKNWKIYSKKILYALQNIKTKYILLADDDDFYDFKNLQKCIDTLNKDLDLVSCGGQTIHFKILDGNLSGQKIVFNNQNKKSFDKNDIFENIKLYLQNSQGIYYCIHRKNIFEEAWIKNNKNDFSYGRMTEMFIEMYLLTCGKVQILPHAYYYRQFDHKDTNSAGLSNEFLDEIIKFNWHRDINIIIDIISKRISTKNKSKFIDVRNVFITSLKEYLRPWVINGINLSGFSVGARKSRKLMIKNSLKNSSFKIIFLILRKISRYKKSRILQNIDEKDIKNISSFLKNYNS